MRAYDDPHALAPAPGIGQLDELLADLRNRGAAATLAVEGVPRAVTPGIDLAAYRIVEAEKAVPRSCEGEAGTMFRMAVS